jgi:hypothetical protein
MLSFVELWALQLDGILVVLMFVFLCVHQLGPLRRCVKSTLAYFYS